MKCDVCCLESDTGFKTRITSYEKRKTLLGNKWKTVRKRRVIFVCTKCSDTLNGLIRSYRRETIH